MALKGHQEREGPPNKKKISEGEGNDLDFKGSLKTGDKGHSHEPKRKVMKGEGKGSGKEVKGTKIATTKKRTKE